MYLSVGHRLLVCGVCLCVFHMPGPCTRCGRYYCSCGPCLNNHPKKTSGCVFCYRMSVCVHKVAVAKCVLCRETLKARKHTGGAGGSQGISGVGGEAVKSIHIAGTSKKAGGAGGSRGTSRVRGKAVKSIPIEVVSGVYHATEEVGAKRKRVEEGKVDRVETGNNIHDEVARSNTCCYSTQAHHGGVAESVECSSLVEPVIRPEHSFEFIPEYEDSIRDMFGDSP